MMTTTGPLELSGFAAGVSVEGPIASVSLRLRSTGGAGFEVGAAGAGSILSCGSVCPVWGIGVPVDGVGAGPVVCAAVLGASGAAAGSGADAARGFISTGSVDGAPSPLAGREDGRAAEGVSEGEAMAAGPERATEGRQGAKAWWTGERGRCVLRGRRKRMQRAALRSRLAVGRAVEGCFGGERDTGDVGWKREQEHRAQAADANPPSPSRGVTSRPGLVLRTHAHAGPPLSTLRRATGLKHHPSPAAPRPTLPPPSSLASARPPWAQRALFSLRGRPGKPWQVSRGAS